VLQQRQERASRLAQVLAEATALRDKARREAGDPGVWRDALAALKRVEGQGPQAGVDALRAEIEAGLNEAERDAKLRQDLVEIRANKEDVGPDGTDAAYAVAFRAAGLDLDALAPAEFARLLKRQPEAVVIEVSAFLDDWMAVRRSVRRPVDARRRKPIEAARLADPDPYRDRLRTILLAADLRPETEKLKALAAAPKAADLPAPTAVLLGRTMADLGKPETAVALLRPAVGRHPSDVWVTGSSIPTWPASATPSPWPSSPRPSGRNGKRCGPTSRLC
jgi:eukaryotic-like serine/threonine-protein kinase